MAFKILRYISAQYHIYCTSWQTHSRFHSFLHNQDKYCSHFKLYVGDYFKGNSWDLGFAFVLIYYLVTKTHGDCCWNLSPKHKNKKKKKGETKKANLSQNSSSHLDVFQACSAVNHFFQFFFLYFSGFSPHTHPPSQVSKMEVGGIL